MLACYPAAGGRATKLGLKPYWGTARPKPCPPVPKGTGGMLPAIAGSGAIMGVPPNVEASGLASGEAPAQLGGTDSVPTAPALPRAAEIALPKPPVPSGPVTALALGATPMRVAVMNDNINSRYRQLEMPMRKGNPMATQHRCIRVTDMFDETCRRLLIR